MKFKFPDLAKDKPRFFLMYYTKIVQLILVYIPALVIMLADSRLMSYQDKAGFADIKAVETKMTGRVNLDTLLLKVFKTI